MIYLLIMTGTVLLFTVSQKIFMHLKHFNIDTVQIEPKISSHTVSYINFAELCSYYVLQYQAIHSSQHYAVVVSFLSMVIPVRWSLCIPGSTLCPFQLSWYQCNLLRLCIQASTMQSSAVPIHHRTSVMEDKNSFQHYAEQCHQCLNRNCTLCIVLAGIHCTACTTIQS